MRSWTISLLIYLFACATANCQINITIMKPVVQQHHTGINDKIITRKLLASVNTTTETELTTDAIRTLPPDYYYNSIGFFCKKELQLQKAVKLPLKLRLGSVNYTDEMEGKGQLFILPRFKK